jgi:hypothetical protein
MWLDINQFFKWHAAPPPNDTTVRQVAEKLASFVAKNGRQFENITRQRNPGDTPFKYDYTTHLWSTVSFSLDCHVVHFYFHILKHIFKKILNLGLFAGFCLTNTVQTTNIMSFALLKRKRFLLNPRRLKKQKMVCGLIFMCLFSIFSNLCANLGAVCSCWWS